MDGFLHPMNVIKGSQVANLSGDGDPRSLQEVWVGYSEPRVRTTVT